MCKVPVFGQGIPPTLAINVVIWHISSGRYNFSIDRSTTQNIKSYAFQNKDDKINRNEALVMDKQTMTFVIVRIRVSELNLINIHSLII